MVFKQELFTKELSFSDIRQVIGDIIHCSAANEWDQILPDWYGTLTNRNSLRMGTELTNIAIG